LWNVVEKGEGCAFFRSDNNCGAANRVPFSLVIPVVGNVPLSSIEKGAFDPFLFATTGYGRSSIFVDSQGNPLAPGDGLEIHLKNQLPTWRADQALLGRSSDRSQSATLNAAGSPVSYQTANGLPWAIEVPARWCYPSEYQDLSIAYPDFPLFVLSNGTQARNWYVVGNAASHPTRGAAGYLYKQDGLLDASCAQ
jgi:LruC domain-containing protein